MLSATCRSTWGVLHVGVMAALHTKARPQRRCTVHALLRQWSGAAEDAASGTCG